MKGLKYDLSKNCYMFFSTLANPTRLAILELLRDNPRNVTDIAKTLKQEQSMISHNLKSLEKCGFVFPERIKRERLYSINKETIGPIFKIFAQHATKYCTPKGKCLTPRRLKERKKKEAKIPLYLSRH